MSHSALSVAKVFVSLARKERRFLSNMQLHKLIYFAFGHHAGIYGQALTHELAEAWHFGPVFPSVYEALKRYGTEDVSGAFSPPAAEPLRFVANVTEPRDLELIETVWHVYKHYSSQELALIVHAPSGPWAQARVNHSTLYPSIELAQMQRFFEKAAA